MRNLDECQAEVFRRSEKRIRKRKQRRNHILMACIPLVLCITLFSAYILPAMMPAGTENSGPENLAVGDLTGDRHESLSCPVAKIEVSGPGFSVSYTDPSSALRISSQLYAYGVGVYEGSGSTGGGTNGGTLKENADGSIITGSIADSTGEGYTITLIMSEGSQTEYYLAGNTLENRTTDRTYNLSQKQVNELKDLLGIPPA